MRDPSCCRFLKDEPGEALLCGKPAARFFRHKGMVGTIARCPECASAPHLSDPGWIEISREEWEVSEVMTR